MQFLQRRFPNLEFLLFGGTVAAVIQLPTEPRQSPGVADRKEVTTPLVSGCRRSMTRADSTARSPTPTTCDCRPDTRSAARTPRSTGRGQQPSGGFVPHVVSTLLFHVEHHRPRHTREHRPAATLALSLAYRFTAIGKSLRPGSVCSPSFGVRSSRPNQ